MDTSIVDEASSPSSSSRSSNDEILYDVFLSCDEDTLKTFTDHLNWRLKRAIVDVFTADENKLAGPKERMKAIEQSRIAVIIFSREYAFSIGCLRELEKIMECRRTLGRMVLPIFYDVDPKDVGKQIVKDWEEMMLSWRKSLIEAANLYGFGVKEREEMMQSWRKPLIEAANLSGLVSTECDGYHEVFVRKIVNEITIKLEQMLGRSHRSSIVILKHARNL